MNRIVVDPIAAIQAFRARFRLQKEAAAALGISEQYMGDLLLGRKSFSDRILEQLQLERQIVKRRRREK